MNKVRGSFTECTAQIVTADDPARSAGWFRADENATSDSPSAWPSTAARSSSATLSTSRWTAKPF